MSSTDDPSCENADRYFLMLLKLIPGRTLCALPNFKDASTQVVVRSPDLASGSLVYPYAHVKPSR